MSSLARQVLRNQIRVRGGGNFGGHAWEHIRRKVLKKMRSGDCTAPLTKERQSGTPRLTARQKRAGLRSGIIVSCRPHGAFKPGTKWSEVQFLQNCYDPTEGVR